MLKGHIPIQTMIWGLEVHDDEVLMVKMFGF